jgi:hypothetical protein
MVNGSINFKPWSRKHDQRTKLPSGNGPISQIGAAPSKSRRKLQDLELPATIATVGFMLVCTIGGSMADMAGVACSDWGVSKVYGGDSWR